MSELLSFLISSRSVTVPGPFFFFSLANIEDSLSGKGGISSNTVALPLGKKEKVLVKLQRKSQTNFWVFEETHPYRLHKAKAEVVTHTEN